MAPVTYDNLIEVPSFLSEATPVILSGSMDAEVYEVSEPAQEASTNLIITSQDWGVKVRWEMNGPLAGWGLVIPATFHLKVNLERMGLDVTPGETDIDLPEVDVLSTTGTWVAADHQMTYETNIETAGGVVPAGAYKVVVLNQVSIEDIQLPIAGILEGPLVRFYETALAP